MSAVTPNPNHPAKYTPEVLTQIRAVVQAEARRIGRPPSLLDPFCGVGRIHELHPTADTYGLELEPEWAACHPRTRQGDALNPPEDFLGWFDMIATSVCMEQSHRVLTNDLRWVPVGDVSEGDELVAFDEHGNGATHGGRTSRRRWRRTTVVRSLPKRVECVRVILENGDEIVTTPEHPWLTQRYAYGGRRAEWRPSIELGAGEPLRVTRGHRRGMRQPLFVHRQMTPWTQRSSFDAGWLSGMFDGEGCLPLGAHGTPKLQLCQVEGSVVDRAERLMQEFGYNPSRIVRPAVGTRQKVANIYVTGGFPGVLRALGELRPTRLLDKWAHLDITQRTVEAELVRVVAVEPAGRREIQEIETTAGTYFGEGYMMHNCYGNRMADHHEAGDRCSHTIRPIGKPERVYELADCPKCKGSGLSPRKSYKTSLGRMPSPGSAAVMHWKPIGSHCEYRDFHKRWIGVALDCLDEGGLLVVNAKNHVRDHSLQLVVEWWIETLLSFGVLMEAVLPVPVRGMRHGANFDQRSTVEQVIVVRKRILTEGQ